MPDANGGSWLGRDDAPRFDPNLGYRPTVSVVILSHRWPEMSIDAIQSIKNQTLPADQIEIIWKHGTVYHGEKLNEGIRAARGRFVVPLPDDDRLRPTALEKMVATADGTGADFVYTDNWLFGGHLGDRALELPEFSLFTTSQRCVPWMSALYRREIFFGDETPLTAWQEVWNGLRRVVKKPRARAEVGFYDPTLQYLDWDYAKRLARKGMVGARIPEPLYEVREHDANGHKFMSHGAAFEDLTMKFVFLDPPKKPLPEYHYPPWYEGRPAILSPEFSQGAFHGA